MMGIIQRRLTATNKTNKAMKTDLSKLLNSSILADCGKTAVAKRGSHRLLVISNKLMANNGIDFLYLLQENITPHKIKNKIITTHVLKLLICSILAGCGSTMDANGKTHRLPVASNTRTKIDIQNLAVLLLIFIVFIANPQHPKVRDGSGDPSQPSLTSSAPS
jgi:hypothetical protein